MGTGIQLEGTWQGRVKGGLTVKETAKDHLRALTTPAPPLPALHLKDPAQQSTDCPSVAGEGPRGAEATGQWDRSRKKEAPETSPDLFLVRHFCPAPPPRSQGPAPAPSGPGEVAPARRTSPRCRAASFSTAARTAPGLAPGE